MQGPNVTAVAAALSAEQLAFVNTDLIRNLAEYLDSAHMAAGATRFPHGRRSTWLQVMLTTDATLRSLSATDSTLLPVM